MCHAVRVDIDSVCKTAGTPICQIAGVELSVAPIRPPNYNTVTTRIQWIPYGERSYEDAAREAYVRQLDSLALELLSARAAREELPADLAKVHG